MYDLFNGIGLKTQIFNAIPVVELEMLTNNILEIANSIYTYHNSVMGILETVTTDYEMLNLDAQAIRDKIANPDNMTLLKDVITKLG